MNHTTATLIRVLYVIAAVVALIAGIVDCRSKPVPQSVAISTSGGERPDVETLLYRIETLELRADGAEDSLKTLWWIEEQERWPRCAK